MTRYFFLVCCLMILPLLAIGQEVPVVDGVTEVVAPLVAAATQIDWMNLLPLIITAVLIPIGVQLIKSFLMPNLSPGTKQIIALIAGPLLMPLGIWLTGLLGAPIDFTPIIIALGGAVAGLMSMGVYDVGLKRIKARFVKE